MVVGNGLIANSFSKFNYDDSILIFASGISDSTCKDNSKFLREKELITCQDKNMKFVYFSTYSLSDGSERNNYLLHKIEMEYLIESTFENWIILRLPTVVGHGGNKNNFFNYMSNKLINNEPICVFDNTYRSLIDVDDILPITEEIIKSMNNIKIDVSFDNQMLVSEIVSIMTQKIESKSDIFISYGNTNSPIDNNIFKSICKNFNNYNSPEYNNKIIKKYLKV